MELITFRVRMYKGIIDSGWVNIKNLAVLVGKNESGKTSLLKALHKLKPDSSESYDIEKEWPRKHRKKRNKEHVVCRAKFRLSDQEKSYISRTTSMKNFPDTVEVSRNYAGELKVKFLEENFSDQFLTVDFGKLFDSRPIIFREFSDQFKQKAEICFEEANHLVSERRFEELINIADRHEISLRESLSSSDSHRPIEITFMKRYREILNNLIKRREHLPIIKSRVNRYLVRCLPTFIYMDDYRIFSGRARLDEIQSRRDEDKLTEVDKTFLTILDLSELGLDELVQLGQGNEEKMALRSCDLTNGAATLTEAFSNHLSQRGYVVTYHTEGNLFFTFIKDDIDPTPVELEERSKGFQWFLSFDLMFMHGSKKTFRGSVILLDEPGLHLHPEAQENLLGRLEEYAKENTILYTTHLPFMIDLDHPDRIQILKEDEEKGIVVTKDFAEQTSGAHFVLEAALGMKAAQSYLVARRNLVVEGVDDYWVLTELSNLLQQGGEEGLPEDVFITPGGSASTAVHIATIMIGQNFDVIALFDSDQAGRDAKDKLVKKWLTGYKKSHTDAILLGDAVGASGDFAIEDLFPDDFYLESVKETYQELDGITLQGEDMLWNRVERALKKEGIKANKGSVAKRLRKRLSRMTDLNELPEETTEKAIKLFQTIREALGEGETESS